MRKKLINLLSNVSCNGNGESLGSCPDRKYGLCGEVAELSYCVIQNIANHLVANGVTIQRWIPVSERLPGKSTYYLCWWKGHTCRCRYWRQHQRFEFNGREVKVTHWMPLPNPPKEGI